MLYHIETKKYQYFVGNMPNLGSLPHIHTHLELVYICSGRATVTVDGQEYPLLPGELSLVFPNQLHCYNVLEPVNVFLVIFSGDMHPQLKKLLSGNVPVCPVLKKQVLPESAEQSLRQIHSKFRLKSGYGRLAATGMLLSFLGGVLPLFSYRESTADHDSVKRILSYCLEHYTEPVTLDTLSRELYLSKYYISHIFSKQMNISVTRFINKLRVAHACQGLLKDRSISQVAFDAGFSSIRTFNRVFLEVMGMSPRVYIRKKLTDSAGSQ